MAGEAEKDEVVIPEDFCSWLGLAPRLWRSKVCFQGDLSWFLMAGAVKSVEWRSSDSRRFVFSAWSCSKAARVWGRLSARSFMVLDVWKGGRERGRDRKVNKYYKWHRSETRLTCTREGECDGNMNVEDYALTGIVHLERPQGELSYLYKEACKHAMWCHGRQVSW